MPPNAQNIRCVLCNTATLVQQNDLLSLSANSKNKVTTKIRGFLGTISNNINMIVASVNSNPKLMTSSHSHYPQLVRPMPSLATVSAKGRKRAVLCGVSYHGQMHRLKGTVNDVRCMKYFLIERMGFPNDSIILLSEEEADPSLLPTKHNIRKALHWLVQGCQSGDSLVFHFSGHGSQQRDLNRDEIDGYDEVLWPVDHQTEGKILDDEINDTIVRPLTQGVKLHAIIDACHSGTILDLPFLCRMNREGYYQWEDHGSFSITYKGTNGGRAISFSACDDHQISLDTTALSGDTVTGAMTYSFIQAIENEKGLTYGRLLNAMRHRIHNATADIKLDGPFFVRKMQNTQVPQLSSTAKFNIYSEPFSF